MDVNSASGIWHYQCSRYTGHFNKQRIHIRKLFKVWSAKLYFFDGDKAGRAAAIRGLEPPFRHARRKTGCLFYSYHRGKNPDSRVKKEGKEALTIAS